MFCSSHHIANDGLSVSLTSCLRHRLNSNCPSMVSLLLTICALWTCYTASLFRSYTDITPLKIIAFPTSLLELLKSGGGKWGILLSRRRKCWWDRRKVLFWVKETKWEDCRSSNQVFFQKGKNFSHNNTLWSQLRYRNVACDILCVYVYMYTEVHDVATNIFLILAFNYEANRNQEAGMHCVGRKTLFHPLFSSL